MFVQELPARKASLPHSALLKCPALLHQSKIERPAKGRGVLGLESRRERHGLHSSATDSHTWLLYPLPQSAVWPFLLPFSPLQGCGRLVQFPTHTHPLYHLKLSGVELLTHCNMLLLVRPGKGLERADAAEKLCLRAGGLLRRDGARTCACSSGSHFRA